MKSRFATSLLTLLDFLQKVISQCLFSAQPNCILPFTSTASTLQKHALSFSNCASVLFIYLSKIVLWGGAESARFPKSKHITRGMMCSGDRRCFAFLNQACWNQFASEVISSSAVRIRQQDTRVLQKGGI